MLAVQCLYEEIKTRIGAISEIEHFDWWNDNILQQTAGTPFPTPAVFFEVSSLVWDPSSRSDSKIPEQQGLIDVSLHIVVKKADSTSIDASEIKHLELVEIVYQAAGYIKDLSYLRGPLQRTQDLAIPAHQVLRDWTMVLSGGIQEQPVSANTAEVTPWDGNITIQADPKHYTETPEGGPGVKVSIQKS